MVSTHNHKNETKLQTRIMRWVIRWPPICAPSNSVTRVFPPQLTRRASCLGKCWLPAKHSCQIPIHEPTDIVPPSPQLPSTHSKTHTNQAHTTVVPLDAHYCRCASHSICIDPVRPRGRSIGWCCNNEERSERRSRRSTNNNNSATTTTPSRRRGTERPVLGILLSAIS